MADGRYFHRSRHPDELHPRTGKRNQRFSRPRQDRRMAKTPICAPGFPTINRTRRNLRLRCTGLNKKGKAQWPPLFAPPKRLICKDLPAEALRSLPDQSALAGFGIVWNPVTEQFDIDTSVNTKSASFTLAVADANKTLLLSTPTTMTLTVPSNSSVAIPIGYKYHLIEIGEGITTFTPGAGVTVNSKNSQLFGFQRL